MVTFAPDQNLSGQRASDSFALAQGLFIDGVSHDLWIGGVTCHRVVGTPSGLQTIKNLNCSIVAKCSYDWDMSLPMGQRRTNNKKSADWDRLFDKLRLKKS